MSNTKICPYYIVNNAEEFAAVGKILGGAPREILHPFPLILGQDGIVFQCPAKDHPIGEYFDQKRQTLYKYELRSIQITELS